MEPGPANKEGELENGPFHCHNNFSSHRREIGCGERYPILGPLGT
jgi:hypothetical protein